MTTAAAVSTDSIGEVPGWYPGDSDWRLSALCAQTDPEVFYPEKSGSSRAAKRICTGCDVIAECLAYALQNGERFGVWGGLSERERRKVANARLLTVVR